LLNCCGQKILALLGVAHQLFQCRQVHTRHRGPLAERDPEAIDPNDPKWRIDFRLQRLKVSLLNAREGRRRFISDAGRDQALQEVEDFEAGIQYT
jgi:hypothetical protein